jgi:hypothetical protein
MRKPQTPRYRWLFYNQSSAGTVDGYGEPTESITFVTSGLFSYEQATKPVEVLDAGATISQLQYLLIGAYNAHYANDIKSDMIAWCPALNDKVVELLADPVDKEGYQERIYIYVVDNVQREYDTGSFPTS